MEYKVVITSDTEEDLDRFVRYLLFVKQNPQAATNVLNDFEKTKQSLSNIAWSLQPCENPHLNALGTERCISRRTGILCSIGLRTILPSWITSFMNCRIMKTRSGDMD